MRLLSTFSLAKDFAASEWLTVREYLIENREHFLEKLAGYQLFVYNAVSGVEMIKPSDITHAGANEIVFGSPGRKKTVSQHQSDRGRPLSFPNLPCIAVRRSSNHYDYFPVEIVFYVAA